MKYIPTYELIKVIGLSRCYAYVGGYMLNAIRLTEIPTNCWADQRVGTSVRSVGKLRLVVLIISN